MNARSRSRHCGLVFLVVSVAAMLASGGPTVAAGLTLEQLAAIRAVGQVRLSPDGSRVAYTLGVPRTIGQDDDGPEWVELWIAGIDGSDPRPYVHGHEKVSAIRFSPDGKLVTYLAKRAGDEHRTLWAIPVDGGESKRIVEFDGEITDYRLSLAGERIAFIAKQPESEARKKARKRGYKQEVFEEDWRPQKLWITELGPLSPPPPDPGRIHSDDDNDGPRELPIDGAVFDVEWAPDGEHLVLAVAPTPLIDDRYMRRRVGVYDAETGERLAAIATPGKLGAVAVSPDGQNVALITAADPNDPLQGRLAVAPITGGDPRDLLPDLLGHVSSMAWRDAKTLAFLADVGEETRYAEVDVASGKLRQILISGEDASTGRVPLMTRFSLSDDGGVAAFVGESPDHPGELYVLSGDDRAPRRLTDSNPWLARVELGRQQIYEWKARDGLTLRGVLIRPLDHPRGDPPPLMMIVHGGPEGHVANGWVTRYSRPGQIAAAGGYVVFYPNYRGSTGRGVDFSKLGQGDAAGPEFDDLIDAVDALAQDGLADKARVGVTGSSYGGYATAWCATRYTDRFRAGVMFVGISNKVSKGLTTEIPYEDRMVHTLFDPWTRWDFSLERSPVFYAEQSRTALLIAGGTADTRVHPSQSLQLYRALKLIDKTAVRYVRYPDEQHGNRRAAARDDYTRRLMRWMDHFVLTDATAPPPYELDMPDQPDEDDPED